MGRFHGKLGFSETQETSSGIYQENIKEKAYVGDILRESFSNEQGEKINPDVTISNRISIIGDAFAFENLECIRYVEWRGVAWQVGSIEISEHRLILSLRGVYNK